MNFLEACTILEIDEACRNPLCFDELKKQYRRKILQYHPDKNHSENAAIMFREIRSAYEFLKTAEQSFDDEDDIQLENVYKASDELELEEYVNRFEG